MVTITKSELLRRKRISIALTGRPKTPEQIAKLPQNQPGRKLTEAHKAKIAAWTRAYGYRHPKGTPMPPGALAKAIAANWGNGYTKGRVMPLEERLRRSIAQKGRPKTKEWKAAISDGQRRRWQRRKEMFT